MPVLSKKRNIIHPHMEPFLRRWGLWECREIDGLGRLPSSIMLIVKSEEGDFEARSYGFIEPQFDEAACRLSRMINEQLEAVSPNYAEALRILYVLPRKAQKLLFATTKDKAVKGQILKRRATVYRHAEEGKIYLTQWMKQQAYFKQYR